MNTHKRITNIATIVLLSGILLAQRPVGGGEASKDETDLWNLSVHNQDALLHDLGPVIRSTGGAARLYVRSRCLGRSGGLFFPRIEVKPATNDKADLTVLRAALATNKDVAVAERQSGLVEISIGPGGTDLLRTNIHELTFKPRERYNYQDAVAAIVGAKEVQAKMRQLRIEEAPRLYHYPVSNPDPKLPHLPASISNVTMDEALDQVARVFSVIVIYEECASEDPVGSFSVHAHEL